MGQRNRDKQMDYFQLKTIVIQFMILLGSPGLDQALLMLVWLTHVCGVSQEVSQQVSLADIVTAPQSWSHLEPKGPDFYASLPCQPVSGYRLPLNGRKNYLCCGKVVENWPKTREEGIQGLLAADAHRRWGLVHQAIKDIWIDIISICYKSLN